MSTIRRVAAIGAVVLRRLARDRVALFFTFVLPFLIVVLVGAANPGSDLLTGIAREGEGTLARDLERRLDRADGLDLRRYDSLEALRRGVRRGEVSGGVVVPRGYDGDLRSGGTPEVTLVLDVADRDSTAVRTRISSVVARQSALVLAARFTETETGVAFDDALERARDLAAGADALSVETTTAGTGALQSVTVFNYVTFGQLVLFMFIIALTGAGDLVEARRLGVTRRMLATPTGPGTLIAGEGAGRYAVSITQALFIVVVGAAVFGVAWGDPLGAAAVVATFGLVATGAGLLLGTIARSNEQAVSLGPPLGIALGMLGGCMWPLEIVPAPMRTIGHLTPHAWAVDAFVDLVGRDAGVADIGGKLLVLAGFATVLLLLGVWRLRRAITG
ncbi:MAG: ABC transporter permease [Acidimicrobiia bacterium]|nr:ABC transporter permease [Acidimicrobiia bacterium]